MTDLTIVPKWNTGINQLESNEYATGGVSGNMNTAPTQLAENIFWLKDNIDTKNTLQDTAIAQNTTDIQAIGSASTTKAGIVQLSTATNSTSTTLAATASAVKAAWDKGNAAIPNTAKGANNGVASLGADGKVPSTQLPTMSSADDLNKIRILALAGL